MREMESGDEKVVLPTPRPRILNGLAISNDGRRIAYVGLLERGNGIFIADVADDQGAQGCRRTGCQRALKRGSPAVLVNPKLPVAVKATSSGIRLDFVLSGT